MRRRTHVEDDLANQMPVRKVLFAEVDMGCGREDQLRVFATFALQRTDVSDLSKGGGRLVQQVFGQDSLEDLVYELAERASTCVPPVPR